MLNKRQLDKRALLKGMIDRAQEQAEQFITQEAEKIKAECDSIPLDAIKNTLSRGLCPCRACLNLMRGD
jgi:hypothetical protein